MEDALPPPPPSDNLKGAGEQPHLTTGEAAKFATLAYTYGSGQGSESDKRAQVLSELEGTGWEMRFDMSNRQLSTLYKKSEDHLHVAHKGTQPNSTFGMMDIVSDVKLGLARESSSYQFNYRLKETEKIYQSIKPAIFTMSGHSLGGATVIYTLENSKLLRDAVNQADTFNAGASPWPRVGQKLKYLNPFKWKSLRRRERRKKKKLGSVVTHHRMEKDFVSISMRARPPYGEIRTYPLKEAVGPDRKGELKKMNIVSKGLEAHHLDHFDDDAKAHMSNYKSTNYKQKGSGKSSSASAPAPSSSAGKPARTKLSVYARPEDLKRRIKRSRSLFQVVQPYMSRTRDDSIPNYLVQDLLGPFKRLKEDIEDRDALQAFASDLNALLAIRAGEDTLANYEDIGGDPVDPEN
jgi:hypothetical protein